MSAVAYTWRSGVIEFGQFKPEGAVALPTADENIISAVARHAYDGKTLLVPGIPEAEDDEEALDALEEFCRQLRKRIGGRS
jgi:hypothetical protein